MQKCQPDAHCGPLPLDFFLNLLKTKTALFVLLVALVLRGPIHPTSVTR